MPQTKKITKKKPAAKKKGATKKRVSKKNVVVQKNIKKPVRKTTATHIAKKKRVTKKKTLQKKTFSKKELAAKEVVQAVHEDEMIPVVHLGEHTTEKIEASIVETLEPKRSEIDDALSFPMDADESTDPVVEVGPSKEKHIDEELTQIYENRDGSMPDMSTFRAPRRHRFLRAFFSLVVSIGLLGLVAYLGFFVFQPQLPFSQSDVIFSISGEEEIMSGEEVRYRIRYRNAQTVPLARTSLQVRYPEGFVFEGTSLDPMNDTNTEWSIGTLEPGDGDYIDVWGRLYGSLGERQSLRAFLNYTPSNFSSEFQKVESLASEVTTSTVGVVVTAAEQIPLGAETQFTITISPKNDSSGPVVIVIDPTASFTLKSSDPAADEDNQYEWSFKNITEDQTIVFTGIFDEGESAIMGVRALQWKDDSHQTEGYIVGESIQEIALISTDLTANLVINGTFDNFSIQPGETMSASIIIKNIGDTDLENVSATLIFDAPSFENSSLLNWPEITDKLNGSIVGEQLSDEIRRGSIAWNRFQVPEFQVLAPGEEVIMDVSLPLKTLKDIELAQLITSEIKIMADIQFDKEGERDVFASNQLVLKVNSDVALDVQRDLEESIHTVRWIVTNSFHDLESLVLEADIFGDITWLEEELLVPAGEVVYDQEAQTLVWTIEQMPTSIDVFALQFAVQTGEANPSQTDLASKIRFTAVDIVTEETITLVGDNVLLQPAEQ